VADDLVTVKAGATRSTAHVSPAAIQIPMLHRTPLQGSLPVYLKDETFLTQSPLLVEAATSPHTLIGIYAMSSTFWHSELDFKLHIEEEYVLPFLHTHDFVTP
jgi:hypothetical protein